MGSDRVRFASISPSPLASDEASEAVGGAPQGAVVTFAGVVRDHDGGRPVLWLNYTAHPSAAAVLADVAESVADRYPTVVLAAAHRIGRLEVGELALSCAVAAAHRADAFAACALLVDEVKRRVPIWKEQGFADGSTEWVGIP